jgi:hypothetical protein
VIKRADADRLVDDPALGGRDAGVDDPARVLVGQVGVVAEDPDHVVHVGDALAEGLAGVQGLGAGDVVPVPQQQVGDRVQHRATLGGRGAGPGAAIEGGPRGLHGSQGVLGVGLGHCREHAAVERVDDRAGVAPGRPVPVDEQFRHGDPRSRCC